MLSILSEKIAQVESLEMGKGFKYLLNEAYRILGNPLLMFNMEYELIASCEGAVTDDPIWEVIAKNGVFDEKTIEFFKSEGFIDDVANSKTVAFLTSDKLAYDRFVGKVFSKDNITVANIVIVASEKPFETYDPIVFENVCIIVSREIASSKFYKRYAWAYQDGLIAQLIDGSILDRELYAGHMANVYGDFQDNLYVGVADTAKCDPGHSKLMHFRDLFKQLQPEYKYFIYSHYIVIIINSEYETLDIKRDFRKLNRLFKQRRIYAGISDCFENVYEFSKYYYKAVSALASGQERTNGQRIFFA